MTMIAMLGAEYGNTKEWSDSSFCLATDNNKRSGTYSFDIAGWASKSISSKNNIFIQFAIYCEFDGNEFIFSWRNGSTILGGLDYKYSDGTLDLYLGNKETLIDQGTYVLEPYNWYVIELNILIAQTGYIECRINGTIDSAYTGDTVHESFTTMDSFLFTFSTNRALVDDIIINDTSGSYNNSWINGAKVCLLSPEASGDYTQWTPSTGANWECVDEIPPSISDYVATSSDNKIDFYNIGHSPLTNLDTLLAVRSDLRVKRIGLSTPSKIKNILLYDGSIYNGTQQNTTANTEIFCSTLWNVNPYTSGQWIFEDILDIQVGQITIH